MSLAIDHLDCRYLVPRNGDPEQRVRARLDHAATTDLLSALQRRVDDDRGDDALCFIETMETDTVLDARANDYGLAQRWAESLWNAVARRVRAGDGVIVFPRRSEYVSAFVLDLVTGAAGSIWYYAELLAAGHSAQEQAARALTADPDAGRDALVDLHARGRLREVLRWLGEERVEAVVAACLLPRSPDFVPAGAPRRWLDAIRAHRFLPAGHLATDTAVLYLQLLRDQPSLGPDVNLARFVEGVLALTRVETLAPLLREDDWTRIRPQLASVEQARFLRTLLQTVGPREVAQAIEELQPRRANASENTFTTAHAGVSLLASSVLDLELPDDRDDDDFRELLFFTLSAALGRRDDATIAAFCGLDAAPEDTPWLVERVATELLRNFARRLGAFSASSAEYLYRNFLRGDGIVTVSSKRIAVRFETCPMRVVLRMAGFGEPIALPWIRGAVLELDLE